MYLELIDKPDIRKQHKSPIVRLGGIAIALGFLLGFLGVYILTGFDFNFLNDNNLLGVVIWGAFFCFLIGLADDIWRLPPLPRLVFQLVVAISSWSQGLRIDCLDIGWLGFSTTVIPLPDLVSLFFTVIWLVGIINAINWLDGLDGLATGVVGIASLGIFSFALLYSQPQNAFIAALLAGSCLGFLPYNLYPARIHMGDGGAYFLGFILSSLSIITFTREIIYSGNSLSAFIFHLPFLILFIPIIDMALVILQRIFNKRNPFYPDRNHIQHRLLGIGLSHRKTVILIYAFSQWLAVITYFLANPDSRYYYLFLSTFIALISVFNSLIDIKNYRKDRLY